MKKDFSDSRIMFDLTDAVDRLRNVFVRHGIEVSYMGVTMGTPEYAKLENTILLQEDGYLIECKSGKTG